MSTIAPDVRHLRCFVAAADAGSVRAAAPRIGLAQSTLTEQIRRLEDALGFAVFDRVGRTVVLTERGRLLLPRARAAVKAVESVADGIAEAADAGDGTLHVGAIPTMSPYLLPRAVAALRGAFPACEVVVHEELTDGLLDRLTDHELEVGVLSPPISRTGVECETVGTEPMVVVASGELASRLPSELSLGELRGLPRVSLSEMHCLGSQIESFCTQRDLRQQVTCHARQLETVFEMVRNGLGVSIVPRMSLTEERGAGVRSVALRRDGPRREIGIVTRAGRSASTLARAFRTLVAREVAMHGSRPLAD
ncbi:MAG: LysR family transcriptional regulator [Planctomycetota bacterium]